MSFIAPDVKEKPSFSVWHDAFADVSISEEPGAVVPHAGIRAGAVGQLAVLPQWQLLLTGGKMKKFFNLFAFIVLSLASCNTTAVMNTLTPSKTPLPKETSTPTSTPRPTVTPWRELMPEDVGLPWDNATVASAGMPVEYKRCYINTATRFHPGSIPMFAVALAKLGRINVIAPISGRVVYVEWQPDSFGQNVTVQTYFVRGGHRVYYQIVHHHESNVQVGDLVERGDVLGALVQGQEPIDPAGNPILDITFYILGPDENVNPNEMDPANMDYYFNVDPFLNDDLAQYSNISYDKTAVECIGNPR
jgi:hypothetical protein